MPKFRKNLILIIIVILIISQPSEVFACSCVRDIPQEESFNNSKAVFSGRVLLIDEKNSLSDKIIGFFAPSFSYHREVKIQVLDSWKGINSDVVTVSTGRGDGDCGFDFRENEEYLIYAYDASENFKTELGTNICNRTQTLFAAWKEVLLLGESTEFPAKHGIPSDEQNLSTKPSLFPLIAYSVLIISIIYFLTRKVIRLSKKHRG